MNYVLWEQKKFEKRKLQKNLKNNSQEKMSKFKKIVKVYKNLNVAFFLKFIS